MASVFDYLDWRGDLPFSAAPLCEVDNLIFSMLSYLDFSGLVPEGDGIGLTLKEVTPLYFDLHPRRPKALGALLPDEIMDLLERCAATRRFGSVRLWAHRSKCEPARELQFSATSFLLDCDTTFVAFRGTDDTIVGWRENLNMAVHFPVPAQEEARIYLEDIAEATGDRLLLGGHSKGGNLAVYAAAFCSPAVQQRIDAVWSNDGPGFLPELLGRPELLAVRDRVTSLLPYSSVVGVLLSLNWSIAVVDSTASAAMQHNGLTWTVLGPSFVRAKGLSRTSLHVDKTFHNLLLDLPICQRQQVIDSLFSAGEVLGCRTISELIAHGNRYDTLRLISSRLTGIDKDSRDIIFRAVRAAFDPSAPTDL